MVFELISNEKNVAKVKLTIPKDAFDAGIKTAYNKNKNKFNVPGFRKGKAPLAIIESKYGKDIFYEDALDAAFPDVYTKCLEEGKFEAVAAPMLTEINEIGENGAVVTIDISLKPEFELAAYKGIKVGSLKYTAKKADLEAKIKELQEKDARLETLADEKSKKDDTVVINFEGFVDGVAFEGGKGEEYPLVLGSNSFIPGFEDQLIGAKNGDKLDVKVKFPEEYHAKELSGKDAVFKVEVLSVQRKELPEVDDEFAIDLGYDNLEAMQKALKEEIKEQKNAELKNNALNKIMGELIEKTEIDLPPMLVEERTHQAKAENDNMLKQNGIEPETYYNYLLAQSEDKDPEQFMKVFERQAVRDIKNELITDKIIEEQNFEVPQDEYDAELEKYAKAYEQSVDEFKEKMGDYIKKYIEHDIKQRKMYDFLLENADTTK